MTEKQTEQKFKKDDLRGNRSKKYVIKPGLRCVHKMPTGKQCQVSRVRIAKDHKCLFHSTDPKVQRLRELGWERTAVATKFTAACPNLTVVGIKDAIKYIEGLLTVFGHRKLSIHPQDVKLLLSVMSEYRQLITLDLEQSAMKHALKSKTQPKDNPSP